jgi:hypothetical protein
VSAENKGEFLLFPGFKVPPTDSSRDIRPRVTICEPPREYNHSDDYDDGLEDEEACEWCEGWGYRDCFCGGDLCVCTYYGAIPCLHCG